MATRHSLYPTAACDTARSRRVGLTAEDGNTLIELALSMPVFLLMVFGFVSFAMVLYGEGNITYACRMVLRYAQTHSSTSYAPATDSQLTNMITPYKIGYPSNTANVSITHASGQNVGNPICIGVTVTYQIALPGYTHSGPVIPTQACGIIFQ